MSSKVASGTDFFQWCCPTLFGPVPTQDEYHPKKHGDWRTVTLLKRDHTGEYVKNDSGTLRKFNFTQEVSTGDLYGIPKPHFPPDEPFVVAAKAIGMCVITPIYMLGMMIANAIKIVSDMTPIFWRVIPKLIADLNTKGIIGAFGNAFMAVVIEVPTEVVQDIWRICRSPLFAIGMMFACLYAPFSPFEARKWIGKIEKLWHEGTSYNMDVRLDQGKDVDFAKLFSSALKGKIWFLGYCMQKRGNIADKVAGKDKFELYDKYA